ncbi:hypothetical protein [Streptomyces nanshensis]|uniref:hypothetical protein n=1 Tax=Streptomyces nanshensis TaxID=518642 RepID=UPI00085C5278|nr:hypothetical protein [Streptomyces nanshensis]
MPPKIRRENYRLTIHPDISKLKASQLLDHEAMDALLEGIAQSITRHTDGIDRITTHHDQRAACEHCDDDWKVLTAAQTADPATRVDAHSTIGEPRCCRTALNEFRDTHHIPRPGTPDAQTPAEPGTAAPTTWGVDLTGAHRDQLHTVSRYLTAPNPALETLDDLRATLELRLRGIPAGTDSPPPLVLVIDPKDTERLDAPRFIEWVTKKGPSCSIRVLPWEEWTAEHEQDGLARPADQDTNPVPAAVWAMDTTGTHDGDGFDWYVNDSAGADLMLTTAIDVLNDRTRGLQEAPFPHLLLVTDELDGTGTRQERVTALLQQGGVYDIRVQSWTDWKAERATQKQTEDEPQPKRQVRSRAEALDVGLTWLYGTEQPAGAYVTHHGIVVHADDNRHYSFSPSGAENLPVVVVNVTHVEYGDNLNDPPKTPLDPGELETLADELAARGHTVRETWNGHPGISGSVGLADEAHPTLRAAVETYRKGCPAHPREGVFCACPEWRAASDRAIRPGL